MKIKIVLSLFFIFVLAQVLLATSITAELNVERYIPARYRVEGFNELLWNWQNELPYTVLEEMCWNEQEGYGCDSRLQNNETTWVINRITDFETGYTGIVYKRNDNCWIWWWQQHHDSEDNPHPALGLWIECPERYVFENE